MAEKICSNCASFEVCTILEPLKKVLCEIAARQGRSNIELFEKIEQFIAWGCNWYNLKERKQCQKN